MAGYDDEVLLKKHILELYDDYVNNVPFAGGKNIDQYSRKSLTRDLSKILFGLKVEAF